MLMNERLVRVQACIGKLAWLPPESSTVPFCNEQDGYFLPPDAILIMDKRNRYSISMFALDDSEHVLFVRYH